MAYETGFAWAYGKPAGTGVIRSRPEDFRVFEIPGHDLSGCGEHVYLKIRKTGANTAWVAARIAGFAGIRPADIGYAGRKDRFAVTEQWFSCYLPGKNTLDWEKLDVEGVTLLEVGRHGKKLRKGDLAGNRFEITVRDIDDTANMENRLSRIRDSGTPNYFGEQRFGRDLANLECADRLLKGGRVPRRNRDIYLSAARSYMFNHYVSHRIRTCGWDDISGMDEGPLYGMSRDPRPGESDLPAECRGWCEGLQSLRVKTGSRNMRVRSRDLQWRFKDNDLELSFTLPPGSFATSLLREVVNYSTADRKNHATGDAGES